MEDALVPGKLVVKQLGYQGLNPCFNGRCTRTSEDNMPQAMKLFVLILVLMEDALVLFLHEWRGHDLYVLILVLMEDALVHLLSIL